MEDRIEQSIVVLISQPVSVPEDQLVISLGNIWNYSELIFGSAFNGMVFIKRTHMVEISL